LEVKIVQKAVSKILEAIFDKEFINNSFGYRRNIGARDAVKKIIYTLQFGKTTYVVEADIKGFFDNINHDWLKQMLTERIDDKILIKIINKWLKAGILEEDGKLINPTTGTQQGGVV
jgi:RNA-directed DNA polymerase